MAVINRRTSQCNGCLQCCLSFYPIDVLIGNGGSANNMDIVFCKIIETNVNCKFMSGYKRCQFSINTLTMTVFKNLKDSAKAILIYGIIMAFRIRFHYHNST